MIVKTVRRLNAGIVHFIMSIRLRALGATLLSSFAGLSLTTTIIPTAMETLVGIDTYSARWAHGGFAVYSMMAWAVGGWAVQRTGDKRLGAIILGFALSKPGQRYIRCAGTLGWGFPAAIGAKCAVPDRPVLCFTGDGGLCYHLAELETAARAGINAVILVNKNGALQQVRKGIDTAYGGKQWGRSKEMWVFKPGTNYARVAEDLGCLGIRVETPGEIRGALEKAFAAGRPTLVDVATDIDAAPAWG